MFVITKCKNKVVTKLNEGLHSQQHAVNHAILCLMAKSEAMVLRLCDELLLLYQKVFLFHLLSDHESCRCTRQGGFFEVIFDTQKVDVYTGKYGSSAITVLVSFVMPRLECYCYCCCNYHCFFHSYCHCGFQLILLFLLLLPIQLLGDTAYDIATSIAIITGVNAGITYQYCCHWLMSLLLPMSLYKLFPLFLLLHLLVYPFRTDAALFRYCFDVILL